MGIGTFLLYLHPVALTRVVSVVKLVLQGVALFEIWLSQRLYCIAFPHSCHVPSFLGIILFSVYRFSLSRAYNITVSKMPLIYRI